MNQFKRKHTARNSSLIFVICRGKFLFFYFFRFLEQFHKKNQMKFLSYFSRVDLNNESKQRKIEQNLIRYNGDLRDIAILE